MYWDHGSDDLVRLLRSHLQPRGLTAAFGGGIGLTDCLIHHQDIRRPLGLPRTIPAERLVEALSFSLRAPVLPSKRNVAGVRVVATDIGWQHGDGPEIRGSGEAILLALAGWAPAVNDLEGPGVGTLAARVAPANGAVRTD